MGGAAVSCFRVGWLWPMMMVGISAVLPGHAVGHASVDESDFDKDGDEEGDK